MKSISLTSGQIIDVIKALEIQEDRAYVNNDVYLASYYMNISNQFHRIYDKLKDLPGEKRVANLVLAVDCDT